MKKCVFVFLFLFICIFGYCQELITWQQLAKVTWHSQYVKSLGGTYDLPNFDPDILALEGKEIQITGFYIPIDPEGLLFAISSQPSSMCFFCSGAGPESVIEVAVDPDDTKFYHIRTDKFIKMNGKLHVNKMDPDHLMYVLKDPKLVEIIR